MWPHGCRRWTGGPSRISSRCPRRPRCPVRRSVRSGGSSGRRGAPDSVELCRADIDGDVVAGVVGRIVELAEAVPPLLEIIALTLGYRVGDGERVCGLSGLRRHGLGHPGDIVAPGVGREDQCEVVEILRPYRVECRRARMRAIRLTGLIAAVLGGADLIPPVERPAGACRLIHGDRERMHVSVIRCGQRRRGSAAPVGVELEDEAVG